MKESEMVTTLILVRHGETEGNLRKVWHGAMDAPLTAKGRLQAKAAGNGMAELAKRFPIDVFYVSPLPRAQSTAAAIAESFDLTPIADDSLREFDLGDWEGRTFSDLRENENLWDHWDADPTFAPPNGESPASFNERVLAAIQMLVEKHPGQTLLVVSHGGLIGNLLATLLGEGPQDWRRWDPPNCSISVLQYVDGTWQPVLVNDISHLPAEALAEAPEYS